MATMVTREAEVELCAHLKAVEEEYRIRFQQGFAASFSAVPRRFGQATRAIFEPFGGIGSPEADYRQPVEPPDFSGPGWDPQE